MQRQPACAKIQTKQQLTLDMHTCNVRTTGNVSLHPLRHAGVKVHVGMPKLRQNAHSANHVDDTKEK